MKKYSLVKAILTTEFEADGILRSGIGSTLRALECEPLSSGLFEEGFVGPVSDNFFQKLSELLTRLPNLFEGQVILFRKRGLDGRSFHTKLIFVERVQKGESYLNGIPRKESWRSIETVIWNTSAHLILIRPSVEDRRTRNVEFTDKEELGNGDENQIAMVRKAQQ